MAGRMGGVNNPTSGFKAPKTPAVTAGKGSMYQSKAAQAGPRNPGLPAPKVGPEAAIGGHRTRPRGSAQPMPGRKRPVGNTGPFPKPPSRPKRPR